MNIEILKKQNNLTVSDDGFIYVKPIDQHNYVTFPIEDLSGSLALTPDEYVLLKAGYYRITEDLTGLEINEIEEQLKKEEVNNEKN